MKERIKELFYDSLAYGGVSIFWLLIKFSHVCELIKEVYYIIFRIPYFKMNDKFHQIVRRK